MRWIVVLVSLFALGAAPATQPVKKRGPSAASLATPYSGPLRFDRRVLAAERKAAFNPDPISRAATWRYYYSVPSCGWGGYWGGYYGGYWGWTCGYHSHGGYYGAVSGYAWKGEY